MNDCANPVPEPEPDYVSEDQVNVDIRRRNRDIPDEVELRERPSRTPSEMMSLNRLPSRMGSVEKRERSNSSLKRKKSKHYHAGYATIRLRKEEGQLMEIKAEEIAEDLIESDGINKFPNVTGVRDLAMSLSFKKAVMNKMESRQQRKSKKVGWFTRTKYSMSMGWMHFKDKTAEVRYALELWRGHLRKLEGHFGTGVTSYFHFLKFLFLINIPMFFLAFSFVVLPQILQRYVKPWNSTMGSGPPAGCTQSKFTGLEILTGGDWFNGTEMYYGCYTNGVIELIRYQKYNMRLAYLLTCAGYYLLCLILLLVSVATSYKENYIEATGEMQYFCVMKVFCGWDYTINAPSSAQLKYKSIFKELQEFLAGTHYNEDNMSWDQLVALTVFRLGTNVVVLALLGGAGYLIWYLSYTQLLSTDLPVLREMALPLAVSTINFLLPFAFSIIAAFEKYHNPRTEVYITMIRTIVLMGVTLGVLVAFWYTTVPCLQSNNKKNCKPCWENYLGQQIYRLVLVDFVFILFFSSFIAEFLRRLIGQFCIRSLGYPEFNIGRNTLNLIYSQALCWLGTFYSPVLSLIMIIKLIVVFYVKRVSVVQNCIPSVRPWRAGRAHTFFLGMLFLAFLMTTIAVFYAIAAITPSAACGPYQGLTKSFHVISNLFEGWQEQYKPLQQIIMIITSTGAIAFVVVVLIVAAYYMHVIAVGRGEMVQLLRKQIALEGKDKMFLLKMLQEASNRVSPKKRLPNVFEESPGKSKNSSPRKTRGPSPFANSAPPMNTISVELHNTAPPHITQGTNDTELPPGGSQDPANKEMFNPSYTENSLGAGQPVPFLNPAYVDTSPDGKALASQNPMYADRSPQQTEFPNQANPFGYYWNQGPRESGRKGKETKEKKKK